MDCEFVDEKSGAVIDSLYVDVPREGETIFFSTPDHQFSGDGISEYKVLGVERFLYKRSGSSETYQCATVRVICVGNTNS